jgi:outer membrane protein
MEFRRVRLGLGLMALAATAAVGAMTPPPAGASSTPRVLAQASAPSAPLALPAAPSGNGPLNAGQPTPFPLNTLAPLTGQTSLPYPAYGTPVPGVNAGTPAPGISATLSLQQSEMIAFARSPLLATARNDVDVQEAEVRLAQAGLLPSLSGSASYDYAHTQPGGRSGLSSADASALGVTTSTSSTSAGFGLSLSQLIYDGGKVAYGVRSARSTEISVADNYRRELETVAYSVATAYYAYLAAERTTQVDLEIVREDTVQEDLVRAQYRAGTAAKSDIATAQLPVAQARVAVVRSQGTELSAEAAYANAMGLDANVKIQPVDDAPVFTASQVSTIPVPSYDVAVKRAFALRPDYDAFVQSVNASKSSLSAARLGLFPTLSGAGSASDNSTDTNAGSFRNAQQIGLSLAIPIYDQGVTAANVANSRAQLNNAFASLQNEALTVQLNVKQSLASLVSAQAALIETQQEYATALTVLQATQAQYRAGVTTLPLLLNAQVGLTQALTDQVTSVYTLRQDEQAYLYAIGANYDTSSDNGKRTIGPLPHPDAQGGQTALHKKRKPRVLGGSGTIFAR